MANISEKLLLGQIAAIKDKAFRNDIQAFLLSEMSLPELTALRSAVEECMRHAIKPTSGLDLCEDCIFAAERDCIDSPRCIPKKQN